MDRGVQTRIQDHNLDATASWVVEGHAGAYRLRKNGQSLCVRVPGGTEGSARSSFANVQEAEPLQKSLKRPHRVEKTRHDRMGWIEEFDLAGSRNQPLSVDVGSCATRRDVEWWIWQSNGDGDSSPALIVWLRSRAPGEVKRNRRR